MLSHENNPSSATNHKLALGSQLATGLATTLVVSAFEDLLGDSYSEKNIRKLEALKRLYAETVKKPAPSAWNLDNKKRPTQRVRWADYVREQSKRKQQTGNFYYQSSFIADYVSTYLSERSKRWFGRGAPGDLLEQFMGEWISFALHELPTFNFDESAIEQLRDRLKYLENLQNNASIFERGRIHRHRNKFDTLENIERQLQACIKIAKKESLRVCARDQFKLCRDNMAGLLKTLASSIYYARATLVHDQPLDFEGFLAQPDSSILTARTKQLYQDLKSSHTGAMLYETILLSGLPSFGAPDSGENPLFTANYFNEDFSPKSIDWSRNSYDLPPWFNKNKQDGEKFLTTSQKLMEYLLRIAQLKNLVEEAYDLTGKAGDEWAYGDKQGKLSLEGLLFLLNQELESFDRIYEDWYQDLKQQRSAYNKAQGLNPGEGINLNFKNIADHYEEINQFCAHLKKSIISIQEKMSQFSEDDSRKINDRKNRFYELIRLHIKKYYPDNFLRFQSKQSSAQQNEELLGLSNLFQTKPEEAASQGFWSWLFSRSNYAQWKNHYLKHHQADYQLLTKLISELENNPKSSAFSEKCTALVNEIQAQLELMKKNALAERPAWRFIHGSLTLGWPFNQSVHQHIDALLKEFQLISSKVKSLSQENVETVIASLRSKRSNRTFKHSESPRLTPDTTLTTSDSQTYDGAFFCSTEARLEPSSLISTRPHYYNNSSTIFSHGKYSSREEFIQEQAALKQNHVKN